MFRAFFRLIGLLCLAGAFAAGVIDGAQSIAAQRLVMTPAGTTIYWAFPTQFPHIQTVVVNYLGHQVWELFVFRAMAAPSFLVLLALGLLLLYVGRRRPPKIGYSDR